MSQRTWAADKRITEHVPISHRSIYSSEAVILSVVGGISSDAPVWIQLAHNRVGGRLSKSAIADICRRRLGTSRFHRLRHTFAVVQEMAGTEVSRIAEALEHKSLDTTTRYLKRLRAQEAPNAEETEAIVGIR